MVLEAARLRLRVLGPPDLLVTSLVASLSARGFAADRVPLHEVLADPGAFAGRGPGVLVVDMDAAVPADLVASAVRAGSTVVALGSEMHRERAAAAIAAGAVAWVLKTSSIEVLVGTVRAAAGGRLRMSPDRLAAWLDEHRQVREAVQADLDRFEQLSPREREVLRHLAAGLRAAEIADLLVLTIATVRSHIRSVLLKLGVNSQQQAAEAYRHASRRLARLHGTGPAR